VVIKQGKNKSKLNLIGTLEIGEEYGVCPLLFMGLLFCFGAGAPPFNPKTQQIIRFAGWVGHF
jgi:hypothetical protein